ncbi:hypothetical protein O3P69_006697 [Scylla paramamosain]|uniref:Uncharacterized protein n=1 Tax=Scylla paramamosain TaxID=85552 RepID=A0AAW0U3M7_SCYPA
MVTTVNRSRNKIEQVLLTEGRVSIHYSSSNDAVTVNISPIDDILQEHFCNKLIKTTATYFSSSKSILSPSVFSWFDIEMNSIVPESTPKDDRYKDSQLLFVRRAADTEAEAVDFMKEKMRNLSEVIGDLATRNILASGEPQCSFAAAAADAAYALTDFNANLEDGDEQHKSILLPVLEYDTNCHSCGDDNTDMVKMDPHFVYTPWCMYHSMTAYVHLYSDNEGPLYDIKFSEDDDVLMIEGVNNNLLDINKPLSIGAVTMAVQRDIGVVNEANRGGRTGAKQLKLFASLDKAKDIVHFMTKGTEGITTKRGSNARECVKREEVVNSMDIKYNKTKYPSPFDSALVKYGFMATDAA